MGSLLFFNIQETNLEIPLEVKKPRRGRPPKTSGEGEKNRPQDVTDASQSAGEKPSGAAVTEAAAAAAGKIRLMINQHGCCLTLTIVRWLHCCGGGWFPSVFSVMFLSFKSQTLKRRRRKKTKRARTKRHRGNQRRAKRCANNHAIREFTMFIITVALCQPSDV